MWIGLFLIFVAVPLLELALLIKLGQWIGFWPTVAIVILTAGLGTAILHTQGFAALRRAAETINQGKPPVEPVFDGFMLMLAGMLLLAPGLITDAFGLLLLIPPVRKFVGRWGLRKAMAAGDVHVTTWTTGTNDGRSAHRETTRNRGPGGPGPVIDGEFERLDEKTQEPTRDDPGKPSPYRNGHAKEP
jgi:UPF0716 protein FxsA